MKIVHIANEVVDTGNGIANSAVDLACMQAGAGHDVRFVSSGGGHVGLLEAHGVRHIHLCQRVREGTRFLADLRQLRGVVRSADPDIVHAHMMTGAVLMWLGRAIAGFGPYGLVTTIHNEWRRTSDLMRLGDRVIVLSENGRRLFRRRGFPDRKLRVVPHGILHSPRRAKALSRSSRCERPESPGARIVAIAGLYRHKGIADLIEAFGRIADEFPHASLSVLGWGPDHAVFSRLKQRTKGGERVHLRGFVADPHAVLRRADVFVLPSHTESWPLAMLEAREAGCAIVGTRVGGVPELLEQGRAGLLIPPRDPAALAQALRHLLSDPNTLARWRRAARTNLGWLTCERMTADTLAVYANLLAQRARAKTAVLSRS